MVLTLSEDKTERWRDFCKQAENEKDPAKLLALVQEIDRLLEARREWQRKSGAPINDT
jgi:hypothetical protein